MKKQINVRLSDEAIVILNQLSKELSISQAAIFELALREFQKKYATEKSN